MYTKSIKENVHISSAIDVTQKHIGSHDGYSESEKKVQLHSLENWRKGIPGTTLDESVGAFMDRRSISFDL